MSRTRKARGALLFPHHADDDLNVTLRTHPERLDQIRDADRRFVAIEVWTEAERLREVCVRWHQWWVDYRDKNDPDPGLAWRFRDTAAECIRILSAHATHLSPFDGASADDLISRLPPAPCPTLGMPQYKLNNAGDAVVVGRIPPWQDDPDLFAAGFAGNGKDAGFLCELEGYAGGLLRLIARSPNALFPQREAEGAKQYRIPLRHRTRPLSMSEAARLIGYMRTRSTKAAVKALHAAMAGGEVVHERINRQQYIFDRRGFPAESQTQIDPTRKRTKN